MKSQSSVGKRIIWALFMIILGTFLTFFMSMFLQNTFPDMNVIYRVSIPALVFVALGVLSYGIQYVSTEYLDGIALPKGVKRAIPIGIILLGLFVQQMYYIQFAEASAKTDIFTQFLFSGKIYETDGLNLCAIYQKGLDVISIIFGNTVFAVGFYNRVYLLISAVLLYFAIKNMGGKIFAPNLVLVLFMFGIPTLELTVKPDAGVVYLLMVSVFLLSVSVVYYFRTCTTNFIAQIISVFIMGSLFAVLFIAEQNSIAFIIPAIWVSFSGYDVQDRRWYYILAIEGMLLLMITCAVVFIMKPEIVMGFEFELPSLGAIDSRVITLLVLNLLGFLGVYGMCNHKLLYIAPALMSMYFVFVKAESVNNIGSDLSQFLCFVLYAVMGVAMLDDSNVADEIEYLDEDEVIMTPAAPVPAAVPVVQSQSQPKKQSDETTAEIDAIKEMNKKLNQVEAGFVPLSFKQPKRQEKKVVDFAFEPTLAQMKYDIIVDDDDDFDI